MKIVISIFSILFTIMSLGVLFAFYRTRHLGLLLIALVYGASAVLALYLVEWWPLTAGFSLAWVLKMVGLEPAVGEQPKSSD
jgi:uncharacterized membrane protein